MNIEPVGLIFGERGEHGNVTAAFVVPKVEHHTLLGLPVTLIGIRSVADLILSSN